MRRAPSPPLIRAPDSIRPWQHVLEALGGYLLIAQRLAEGHVWAADAWNFGPSDSDTRPVSWIADRLTKAWNDNDGPGWTNGAAATGEVHEAKILKLDCSKARAQLGWRPALGLETSLEWIVEWHRHVANGGDARSISTQQLKEYLERVRLVVGKKGN